MVGGVLGRLLNYPLKFRGFKSTGIVLRNFGQVVHETHPHIIGKGQVTPGITTEEYFSRRCELMKNIFKANPKRQVIAVVPSAAKLYMAHDVPYPFRQNSDFLYLCGFQEPDSVLLMTNIDCHSEFKSVMFVPKRDKLKELWDGPRTGSERAVDLTGCDEAHDIDDLEKVLCSLFQNVHSVDLWYDENNLLLDTSRKEHLRKCLVDQRVDKVIPIRTFIQTLRLVKSEAEISLMKHSCKLGSKCLEKVMEFSNPGINESHLYAKMDFECRTNGADRLAYPPVVAGGDRANIIHYISNNQVINDGEMVLMDAGCEYHGYCSDITRVWPVNGKFSPKQRELYEALLEVQLACISLCRADSFTLNQIYQIMLNLLGKQLQRLNIIRKSINEDSIQKVAASFCPHHTSHYLGMDVHDVDEMSRSIKLKPGMIITVEPGIYIPKDNENVPREFRGIGIRIEDNILITSGQPINLTEKCPKFPDDIERTVSSKS